MEEKKEKTKLKLWFLLLVVFAVIGFAGEAMASMISRI